MPAAAFSAHDGLTLPAIGFGTVHLRGEDGAAAIGTAIGGGYRLLDSAYNYENEATVGQAVRRSGIPRDQLIVTSKLPGRYHAPELARQAIEEGLWRTGLDAFDLYLIHWPNPGQVLFVQAWQALLEARDAGLIRHVGVSNFTPEHLEQLREQTGELPAVNQIELHPRFPQLEALAYHREHQIITEAWSPLRRGKDVYETEAVTAPAARLAATPAQVVLAWHAAIGSLPIPKSADPIRQQQNLQGIDLVLTTEEVAAITALGRPDGRMKNQDPAVYEEF